jgi:hypothetical protein
MPEKCQIIKTSVFASCETYNCQKKVAWAIGRPDGPIQLHKFYCDQCIRDIVASVPYELLPEDIKNLEREPVKSLDEPVSPIGGKVYTCEHCGKSFDTGIEKGRHVKNCKAKKAAANG